jgi:hypothetical protein|tara:strand:+ start:14722 stop:14985 length:264 start_codon:yes stop_codon:yes gene_type:complete
LSDETRSTLQQAIDAHLVDEFGDFAMARDWVLTAHVVSIGDVSEQTGRISIVKGSQTTVFSALGILMIANDTYRYQTEQTTDEDDDD